DINGRITKQKLQEYFPQGSSFGDNKTTKVYVTAPDTWMFRGYNGPDDSPHVAAMKQGRLYSKANMRLDKELARGGEPPSQIISDFWERFGPNVQPIADNGRNPTTIVLRILAIQTSDTPPSQFISVALDHATAKTFGDPVYAFQGSPNSPLLGLVNCQL